MRAVPRRHDEPVSPEPCTKDLIVTTSFLSWLPRGVPNKMVRAKSCPVPGALLEGQW